jgi:hypothetical protein
MVEACDTHEREEKCIKVWVGKPKGKDNLKNLAEDGKVISLRCSHHAFY